MCYGFGEVRVKPSYSYMKSSHGDNDDNYDDSFRMRTGISCYFFPGLLFFILAMSSIVPFSLH